MTSDLILYKALTWSFKLWAQTDSNRRPLGCKPSALPLSYAPFKRARVPESCDGPPLPSTL